MRFGIRDLLEFVALFSLYLGNYLAIRSHWPKSEWFTPFDAIVAMFIGFAAFLSLLTWNIRRFLGPVIYRTGRVWPMCRHLALATGSALASLPPLLLGSNVGLVIATTVFLLCLGIAGVMLMQLDAQLRERGLTVGGNYWKWESLRYKIFHYGQYTVFSIVDAWYRSGRGKIDSFRVTSEQYSEVLAILDAKGAKEVVPKANTNHRK